MLFYIFVSDNTFFFTIFCLLHNIFLKDFDEVDVTLLNLISLICLQVYVVMFILQRQKVQMCLPLSQVQQVIDQLNIAKVHCMIFYSASNAALDTTVPPPKQNWYCALPKTVTAHILLAQG